MKNFIITGEIDEEYLRIMQLALRADPVAQALFDEWKRKRNNHAS